MIKKLNLLLISMGIFSIKSFSTRSGMYNEYYNKSFSTRSEIHNEYYNEYKDFIEKHEKTLERLDKKQYDQAKSLKEYFEFLNIKDDKGNNLNIKNCLQLQDGLKKINDLYMMTKKLYKEKIQIREQSLETLKIMHDEIYDLSEKIQPLSEKIKTLEDDSKDIIYKKNLLNDFNSFNKNKSSIMVKLSKFNLNICKQQMEINDEISENVTKINEIKLETIKELNKLSDLNSKINYIKK
jgi:hypothetical protein